MTSYHLFPPPMRLFWNTQCPSTIQNMIPLHHRQRIPTFYHIPLDSINLINKLLLRRRTRIREKVLWMECAEELTEMGTGETFQVARGVEVGIVCPPCDIVFAGKGAEEGNYEWIGDGDERAVYGHCGVGARREGVDGLDYWGPLFGLLEGRQGRR